MQRQEEKVQKHKQSKVNMCTLLCSNHYHLYSLYNQFTPAAAAFVQINLILSLISIMQFIISQSGLCLSRIFVISA